MTAKQDIFLRANISKLPWGIFFLILGIYNPENLSLQFKNKQGSLENGKASKYRTKYNTYPASPGKKGLLQAYTRFMV